MKTKHLIIIGLFFYVSSSFKSSELKKQINIIQLGDTSLNNSFNLYGNNISDSIQLILFGETHYQKRNDYIYIQTIKNLVSSSVIQGIVVEDGFCSAYVLNELIFHNNIELANGVFSKNEIKKYRQLFDGNSKILPFEIRGVDYEKSPYAILKSITHLSKKNQQKEDLIPDILKQFINNDYDKLISTSCDSKINSLLESYINDSSNYLVFFGEDYKIFEEIINSIKEYFKFSRFNFNMCNDIQIINERELLISNKLFKLLSNSKKRYFGQFGAIHIPKVEMPKNFMQYCKHEWKSSIALLAEKGVERVVSIQILYKKFGSSYYQEYLHEDTKFFEKYFRKRLKEIIFINLNINENHYRLKNIYFGFIII